MLYRFIAIAMIACFPVSSISATELNLHQATQCFKQSDAIDQERQRLLKLRGTKMSKRETEQYKKSVAVMFDNIYVFNLECTDIEITSDLFDQLCSSNTQNSWCKSLR